MEAYLDDLRQRVVEAYDRGTGSLRELAELFGVSRAWIGKLLKLRRQRLIELAGSDPSSRWPSCGTAFD